MDFPLHDLLRLHFLPAIGPYRAFKLIKAFKNPDSIYRATYDEIMRVDGFNNILSKKFLSSIRDTSLIELVNRQIAKLKNYDTAAVTILDDTYPGNLLNIYSPPLVLFVRGELKTDDVRCVAVVGSRTISEYGRLAAGIDTEAHWAAIRTGGRTVAVLGCGIDVVYPASNNSLYKEIMKNGAVISEFPFGMKPWPGNFPQRNRIISGMALGTLVVEAGEKSGALITASVALEQNREVFAIPGNISRRHIEGSNALIRDGAAKLVQNAEDVINEL